MTPSPINTHWFTQMTLASIQKQLGTATNPMGHLTNDSSHFLNIFKATMNNNAINNQPFMGKNQFHPANFSFLSDPLALNSQSLIPVHLSNQATDLQFKPMPFIKLDNMLKGKLAGSAMDFIQAGQKYDIHPALLSAIAIHETGNGSSRAVNEKLNVAGMMGRNGLRNYDSIQESIFDMARNLRENYFNQGRNTIDRIGAKYAPVGATNDPTGLNNHWVTGITSIFNRLT